MGSLTDINEGINHWLWRRSIALLRDSFGEHGGRNGAPLLRTLRGR